MMRVQVIDVMSVTAFEVAQQGGLSYVMPTSQYVLENVA